MSTGFPQPSHEHGATAVKTWQQAVVLSIAGACDHPVSSAVISEITGATRGASNNLLRSLAHVGMVERAGDRRVGEALEWLWAITDRGRDALRRPRCVALLVLVGGSCRVGDDAESVTVTALDDEGWDEVAEIVEKVRPDLVAAIERSATRQVAGNGAAA